jgi:hypothetical protein
MHSSARLWRLKKAIAALCSASTAGPPRVITGLPRAGHRLLTGTCGLAGKTWTTMRIVTALGVVALAGLCVLRRHDLATAAGAMPPQALGALGALHLASLVARSEAWRLSLAALAGAPPRSMEPPSGWRRVAAGVLATPAALRGRLLTEGRRVSAQAAGPAPGSLCAVRTSSATPSEAARRGVRPKRPYGSLMQHTPWRHREMC